MSERVVIRLAEHDDVEGINVVHSDVLVATYTGITYELTEDVLSGHVTTPGYQDNLTEDNHFAIDHPEEKALLVADAQGAVVAYGLAETEGVEDNRIRGLYVARQRRGIGTELLKQMLNWLPLQSDVDLDVVPRTPAVRMYEKFGFRDTGDRTIVKLQHGEFLPLNGMTLPAQNRVRYPVQRQL